MACSIAENVPLKSLAEELNLPHQCHSTRPRCIQGFEQRDGNNVFGIPGAAIGYCQALFNYEGTPEGHTKKVVNLLSEINAPWVNSHELFWGYKNIEATGVFLHKAIMPLVGTGRIPILITGLDPANDFSEIDSIISSQISIHSGETVLLRMVLGRDSSVKNAAKLLQQILADCRKNNRLPTWFPLLQGNLTIQEWKKLKLLLGSDWKYTNIAVNPFIGEPEFEFIREQITVAQIPIGLANGISNSGIIRLAPGMKILGASEKATYSLGEYFTRLNILEIAPTLIVLGPSLPEWSDVINQRRIQKLLPVLRQSCNILWDGLSSSRRNFVWQMTA